MVENGKFCILENGVNSLFCVLQIMHATDRKHSKNLDKIKKLEQNLNNEKTNVSYCFSKRIQAKDVNESLCFLFYRLIENSGQIWIKLRTSSKI